jgi:hypothetical protein
MDLPLPPGGSGGQGAPRLDREGWGEGWRPLSTPALVLGLLGLFVVPSAAAPGRSQEDE